MANSTTIYTQFDSSDKAASVRDRVVEYLFSNNNFYLPTTIYTSSVMFGNPNTTLTTASGYYVTVYLDNPVASASAEPQFSIAYGDYNNNGNYSQSMFGDLSQSLCTYYQYKNMLLPPTQTTFTLLGSGSVINRFIAINFDRARTKERIDPGNWRFAIRSASAAFAYFYDTSTQNTNTAYSELGESYQIFISGSGITNRETGIFYPDYGLMLLDVDSISTAAPGVFQFNTGSYLPTTNLGTPPSCSNQLNFYEWVKNACSSSVGTATYGRCEEHISSTYYFIRVKNQNYNYSNNPTFVTSSGYLKYPSFYYNPHVYLTGIGLYNDNYELLAVAKISQPIQKDFDSELLFRIKLNF
ncbi:MAG: hypothetical protein M0R17_11460 [Candidatus Omnitrophica bacterium]|jgi:hypothetical protein|nr:hypothetical protein [Candidatus Omnitrophota bacterium]